MDHHSTDCRRGVVAQLENNDNQRSYLRGQGNIQEENPTFRCWNVTLAVLCQTGGHTTNLINRVFKITNQEIEN
jgi:hypothetical protein